MPTPAALAEFRAGWRTVLASSLGVAVGLGGLPFFTLGVFLKPLAETFDWSRAQVSATSLCLSAGSALTAPFIGRLADAIDVRRIVLASLAALSLAYLVLTQAIGENIALLYLGLTGLALAGCGTSPLVWILTVNTWFDRARGLALGLTLAGSGIAAILAPRAVDRLIQAHGWQGGYVGMALFTGGVALPVIALLFRGKKPMPAAAAAEGAARPGREVGQALRSRAFWQLAAGILLVAGAVGAMLVHLVPLLTDAGTSRDAATATAGLAGLAVVLGRIGTGLLVDRFHAPHVAALVLSVPAAGFLLLAWDPQAAWTAMVAAVLFGLAVGAEVDLLAYLAGRLFGLRAFGTIYGLLLVAFLTGGGVGPILLGLSYDRTGDYALGLVVAAGACLAGATLLGSLGRFPDFTTDPAAEPAPPRHAGGATPPAPARPAG